MRKPSSFLRACSLLTGFLMVMALFAIPMTVQADAEYVCAIGETQYETLDAALAAIGEGESEIIRLLKDIDYFGTMMIKGKTVTFDLNGYELFVMNTDLDNGLVVDDGVVNMVGTGQFFAIGTGNPGHGVLAQNGGQATVTGAIGRSFGVKAIGAGSFVHVRGDVTLSENAFFGVEAESGGAVQVDGDIDASKGWYGATAYSNGSIVVKGNIETQYEGVHAYEGSSITVYGDVTVASSVAEGAIAEDSGSTVWVMGNITANSGNSTGAIAKNSGLVTVDGTISAPTYIQLGTENKTPADFVPGTGSDAHYKVYTDGTNTVRVLNNAPTAKAVVPAQTVIVGGSTAAFTATDIAEDADGDNLSITAIITSPDSAVVSASIDSGTITLTGVAAGSTSIVVTVSDVTDTVNITVPIIVTVAPGAPTIITASLPDGMIGTAYSQMLEATGDTPITWSLDTGSNLPDGLSLTTDGVISGTPVTAGTFTFTVKAENAAGNDTKELSIIISMAPIAPSITTASLPDGMAGTAYSQTLEATGDTPIIWSLDTGSNLPDGLSLTTDGVISGIPVTAGTFTFTVKAENAAGDDTKELSITISAESANTVPIARDPVPAQIVSSGDTAAFTAADIAEDADGDSLSIAAIVTSPDSSIATASLDSSTVILTGVAAGSTSIVVTVSDGTDTVDVAVPITVTVAPFITYTVSFDSRGGSSVASITGIAPGSVITAPASPSRTGYSFGGWYKETSCVNAWNFSVDTVTANITLYAKWTYNDGDDSSGGGSTGGGVSVSTPATPTNKAVVSGTSTAEISLPVIVNTKTGNAAADLGTLAKDIFTGKGMAVLTVPSIPDVNSYTMEIAADCLAGSQQEGVLSFSTDVGSITIPADMLGGMTGMEGKQAGITIAQGDKNGLPAEVQAAIGDRPFIQLILTIDGKETEWNNPNAPVTVSIPYTPTAAELADPEHIVIWYIDGSGNVISVPNGRYDADTGTVSFFTTHFSYYAVTYVHKSFSDLGSVEWARKAIETMASKGITNGTGDGTTFSPGLKITRADFTVLLIKTLGLTAAFTENFDDVKPDAYYYSAVGTAKKLGIAAGCGNNLFKPMENISRQDMMVLAARALEKYQGLEMTESSMRK